MYQKKYYYFWWSPWLIIGEYIVNESSRCCSHPGRVGYDREKAIDCDYIK